MKSISYNIRGGGIPSKQKQISIFLKSSKVDVCFIQETKLQSFSDELDWSFYGGRYVEWMTCNSLGASGGMVILCRKCYLSRNYTFIGMGFVDINILWKGKCYNLVNVYALCNVAIRRYLWDSLVSRNNNKDRERRMVYRRKF